MSPRSPVEMWSDSSGVHCTFYLASYQPPLPTFSPPSPLQLPTTASRASRLECLSSSIGIPCTASSGTPPRPSATWRTARRWPPSFIAGRTKLGRADLPMLLVLAGDLAGTGSVGARATTPPSTTWTTSPGPSGSLSWTRSSARSASPTRRSTPYQSTSAPSCRSTSARQAAWCCRSSPACSTSTSWSRRSCLPARTPPSTAAASCACTEVASPRRWRLSGKPSRPGRRRRSRAWQIARESGWRWSGRRRRRRRSVTRGGRRRRYRRRRRQQSARSGSGMRMRGGARASRRRGLGVASPDLVRVGAAWGRRRGSRLNGRQGGWTG